MAALAWVLFLMATYSPLSDLAIQAVIGGIVAYYYLLFGLKWGALLALTIGILTTLQPGIPLNLALVLFFLPWPLIKGYLEARVFHRGELSDEREERRRSLRCWFYKFLFATAIFVAGYFLLQTFFMGTLDQLRDSIDNWLVPRLGEMAAAGPVLLFYPGFLIFTFLYEQVLILVMDILRRH